MPKDIGPRATPLFKSLENEELTGLDYISKPIMQLIDHPDFSPDALRNIVKISNMTTAQLEGLTKIFKEMSNG